MRAWMHFKGNSEKLLRRLWATELFGFSKQSGRPALRGLRRLILSHSLFDFYHFFLVCLFGSPTHPEHWPAFGNKCTAHAPIGDTGPCIDLVLGRYQKHDWEWNEACIKTNLFLPIFSLVFNYWVIYWRGNKRKKALKDDENSLKCGNLMIHTPSFWSIAIIWLSSFLLSFSPSCVDHSLRGRSQILRLRRLLLASTTDEPLLLRWNTYGIKGSMSSGAGRPQTWL